MEYRKSTNVAGRRPRRQNQENVFFKRLVGQLVSILFMDGTIMRGKIAWIERYTIGLDLKGHQSGKEIQLIYKHAIMSIRKFTE